jgi:RNA recognition motif-containing protein
MGKKLYVGNLPYSATEEALSEKFSVHGKVESVKLIIDRDSGKSKGFGFVEMSSNSEADAAMSALDGADYEGRPMRVNEAKPQTKRPGGGGGGRGGYGGGGGGGYGGGGGGGYGGGGGGGRW